MTDQIPVREGLARDLKQLADQRMLGFNDLVTVSGIDPRQIRNGFDRGLMPGFGEKHRSGRWTFSIRDCFYATAFANLTSRTWMPLGPAAEVARRLMPFFDRAVDGIEAAARGEITIAAINIWIENGEIQAVLHERSTSGGGGYTDLDGNPAKHSDMGGAYIRIPLWGLMSALMQGAQLAFPVIKEDEPEVAVAEA